MPLTQTQELAEKMASRNAKTTYIYIYMLHRKNDIPTMLGFKFNLFRAPKILFLCNSSCFVPTLGVRC